MTTHVQVFNVDICFHFFGIYTQERNCWIIWFNFLCNHQAFFPKWPHILHPPHQRIKVPISPGPRQHMLLSAFFIIVILVGLMQCLNEVLICVSVIFNDVEHLFTYLLAICISPFQKSPFTSFAHILIGLSFYCCVARVFYVFWI